ncbi:hypothetical protein FRC08_009572 [Ceratobasidium sp. 394]|nr:hypothetical protein FRC08_009572 [Ceratobasidium sp. 394]
MQMEAMTAEEPSPATGKRGKKNQQAAKGGAKATQKGQAAAGEVSTQATTSATTKHGVGETMTAVPAPSGPASRPRRTPAATKRK